ncbi:hypothetical protein [Paenibacillus sp. FSL H7-0331]|uniref:hypothetical protein n=1 Tax=Paenibacillus sp. FSL H7-0331 TaxID=1920421 RepID=UPI0015C3568B|nr:hypothetical protein [Paenibacillus sp. FSL H7-0331]
MDFIRTLFLSPDKGLCTLSRVHTVYLVYGSAQVDRCNRTAEVEVAAASLIDHDRHDENDNDDNDDRDDDKSG